MPASGASAASGAKPFTGQQLDQMLAPIALYPDGLLAQVLMAATYPLEVVEAARWVQDNPSLKGDAAVTAAKGKGWDVSVTSLVAFPQVLTMMNSKLDWTQNLGDAMLAQQSDVAGAIQQLRAQAKTAGNLKSTSQQTVTSQPPSAGAPSGTPNAIVIDPANTNTVYVPYYDPNQAYGSWPYSDYPPTYFPPPPDYGWVPGLLGGLAFGVGIGVGFGFFGGWGWGGGWGGGWGWGGWGGWGGGNTYVNVNNNVNHINNNYNHNNDHHWHHDPAHRHGVPYRDRHDREKYGQHHPNAAQRQAFRDKVAASPRTSGLQGAGQNRTEQRANEQRAAEQRANQNRANENRARENRAQENRAQQNRNEEHRGYQDRSHAFSGADHGHQVTHEAQRGHSYAARSRPAPHGHAYRGGGGHGGGGHPHGGGRR